MHSIDQEPRDLDVGTPFHAGERAVQRRLGVRERIEPFARRVVRPFLPEQHRDFYAQLPFVVAAARDRAGRPWATLLSGPPGFLTSPTPTRLEIDARPAAGDALEDALDAGADLGLLGLDFATRRRNRVNGRILDAARLTLAVDQSFGNCPQYIHGRDWYALDPAPQPRARRGRTLGAAARARIAAADTFFIASGHRGRGEAASFGMDASHRGGEPGFVEVRDARTLTFPDYAGNNHFNTIGNLTEDPRVGLLFVDFEAGHLLQLTGRAVIDWDSPAVAAVPGAQRLVTVHVDAVVEVDHALPLRWQPTDCALRSLTVLEKTVESADVTSFLLGPRDGGALPDFEPGQSLPLALTVDGTRVRRNYSLSAAPDPGRYRISVKREPSGLVSSQLHDRTDIGDILAAGAPAGDFVIVPGNRPLALISAGVGVTPMMSMLEALAAEQDPRPVTFVHGARDGAHHPFRNESRRLAARHGRTRIHVAYSRPRVEDAADRDFDESGRVSAATLTHLLGPGLDADFYLCGPGGFVADISAGLLAHGVPEARIRAESFGPTG